MDSITKLITCSLVLLLLTEPVHSEQNNNFIIFIPGFKGSFLSDIHQKRRWVTAQESIFGRKSLTLPNAKLSLSNEQLFSDGVINEISIIPFLYAKQVYKPLLEFLHSGFPDQKVIEFDYDWRQDLVIPLKRLDTIVENLKNSNAHSISIVAHSMGGLITSHYLRYGTQDPLSAIEDWHGAKNINKVVYAGTPFRGSLEIFDDMLLGLRTVLNNSLLSAKAYSTFITSYILLPDKHENALLNERNKPLDLYNAEIWKRNSFGLFKFKNSKEAYEFTKYNLERSGAYARLRHDTGTDPKLPLEILNIIGTGHATQSQAMFDEVKHKLHFSQYRSPNAKIDGDSVVTSSSAKLPMIFKHNFHQQEIFTNGDHISLLSTKEVKSALSGFLSN